MIQRQSISIFICSSADDRGFGSFLSYLESMPQIRLESATQLPDDLTPYDVVITFNQPFAERTAGGLTEFVSNGGGWLMLVHLADQQLPEIFGVQPEPVGPSAELRVLFEDAEHPLAARLPDAIYLHGRYHGLQKTSDNTETILYADWLYTHRSVLTYRRAGKGRVACTTLQAYDNPKLQPILYRILHQLAGIPTGDTTIGAGILGYAPSVGQLHGLGAEKTAGLNLRAICDLNPERIDQAGQDFPESKIYHSADELAADPDVDLVIVATPPNTHAQLCIHMMSAGKHVVCEKPLALNRRESDALMETAAKHNVHLSCHQNRRWDPDYLAIRQSLTEGLIGECFYMETFVGGFHHPCGYWHSHAAVSGGTAYDWGAHYLDWIVSLIPDPIETVMGTRHKRVWHDVTNADQERILIRYAGGKEAEFIHSDIAAARKPKWYLLGTQGAIVGRWRDVTSYQIDPLLYFEQHNIPATEMYPDITVYQRQDNGQVINIKPAIPEREHYRFHANLADHLLLGEPLAAPLADSVKVVAILEATARSMANGGSAEVLNDGSN